jgi:hypothetical protein
VDIIFVADILMEALKVWTSWERASSLAAASSIMAGETARSWIMTGLAWAERASPAMRMLMMEVFIFSAWY